MENYLVPVDEYRVFNKKTGKREFASPQSEADWNRVCLEGDVRMRESYEKVGVIGKIGIAYMGLRAMGHLAGIGRELNPLEVNLLDATGVVSAFIGGVFLASGKLIQHTDERISREDYQRALDKLNGKVEGVRG